ncbi:thiopurine S-methyltransferase [Thalassotalea atypica]|uniref:thiopurine S-methyltransferase n=1 Tax=Thalassotalea atypica TaxID=2054316 RepID=UPI002572A1BB|nr:thiopurine S-methyltransferase [Thalassotalea atypica]
MDASFWHRCWERNSLGFHQGSVHPFLTETLDPLFDEKSQRVFVPLCGKSLDMFWLAERMDVVGSELSKIACHDFFTEQNIAYETTKSGDLVKYSFDNISLWQGDFFKLPAEQFPAFDWIYDRAAIIALPQELQEKYVAHLSSFVGKGTKLALISLEFPEHELTGPPFPVTEKQVNELFSEFKVDCIASKELPDRQFAQRVFDVSYLKERLYIIERLDS